MRRRLLLAACWLGPALAWGQTPGLADHGATYYLLRALLSLAVVIALIYLVYFLLRRWQGQARGLSVEGPARLVQSLPLAGGNALHLVRIGRKLLAIAAGPQGVSKVGDFDWQEVSASDDGAQDAR